MDYNGQRAAQDLAAFALRQLPTTHIESVASEQAVTAFVERNPELPKVVLFSKKAASSSLYRALSLDFRGRLELAQANLQQSSVYDVQSAQLPVVLVIPAQGGASVRYDGSIDHASLYAFLDQHALPRRRHQSNTNSHTGEGEQGSTTSSPPAPPLTPEAPQLHDQAAFEAQCSGHSTGVCVIGVMDGRGSAPEDQQRYLDTMQALSEEYTKFFRFSWLDGSRFPGFCEQFGLTSGFPALVVYSPSKQLQTPYIGSFSQESISAFLTSVMRGKKRSFPVADLPTLVAVEEQG
jgi:protein disulfide-isomerase A6